MVYADRNEQTPVVLKQDDRKNTKQERNEFRHDIEYEVASEVELFAQVDNADILQSSKNDEQSHNDQDTGDTSVIIDISNKRHSDHDDQSDRKGLQAVS